MVEVVHQRGSVAELHALDPFSDGVGGARRAVTDPQVWWCEADDAALVLGSRQSPDLIDRDAVVAAGLGVVRRRSGGGAVIVRPDAVVWIDVVLPHGLAPDDVRGAMVWMGERWRAALTAVADVQPGPLHLAVHRGGMLHNDWSDLVCFAGVGPGEVLLAGRKLVGLSQRRTRQGLRLQGMLHTAATSASMAGLFAGRVRSVDLPEPAAMAGLVGGALAEALAAQLT